MKHGEDPDRTPMGEPEATMAAPGEMQITLLIPVPFGLGTDALLSIHAIDTDEPGGEITLAITRCRSRPAFVPGHSNPRRRVDP